MKAQLTLLLALLAPLPALSIGYVYTGVGDDGRQHLELTSVTVAVQIDERIARTRTDQIFTNHADWEVEGIYEFTLPEEAIITDLVLWIGDKRIQGEVLEKEEARRTYDDIVGRRIDPALIEQVTPNQFRLSIFPFPAKGSRRVEFEYMQLLESHSGRLDYTFPLAPETDQPLQMELFVLRAQVRSQHAFEVTTSGLSRLTEVDRPDAHRANIFFGDEQIKPREDFTLTIRQTDDRPKPSVLSFAPRANDDLGYYALWLPPLPELTQGGPLPRSLTFVIDISSSMQQGKLQAVKGALVAAIDALDSADLFNIVVFTHRADSFAAAPVPADPDNKKAATAFINQQDALGVSNFEAGLGRAMQQAFPANRVNHVIFLTDGLPTLGELELEPLSELVGQWSAGQARLFTIGVGRDVDQGFLTGLAEEHRGEAYFLSEEGDIEAALQELFESFTFPILLLDELSFDQVEIHDVHPRGLETLAAGRELFQVGRYRGGGTFTLSLIGHVGEENVSVDFPLEFTQNDVSGRLIPRLWAYQKIQALEEQIARFGEQQELLDDILALGLEYQLVTRRTSLFAPDDGVEVNPEPRDELAFGDFGDSFGTTNINDARPTTHWLGRDFVLQDEVWIDMAYQPGMPKELYEGRTYQPAELANFARLGQAMLVVVEEQAYEIPANAQGSRPVLLQNAPNPFNASTVISFLIPFRLANEATRLSIYNLTGQLVRVLQFETLQAGEHSLSWDGRDNLGREVASGVYIYRLDVGEWAVHRRMLLLR
ncbi:MAG: VWA domain-containing protein [Gemmatimonadetes bacterium]|nr:VWA domain-containing protein [Gemmatimonadota bacterium]MYC74017.1 VWA domain-containing protein [Gemmatimonadota bacterium]MYI62359.1 VWA domain-containing protein [Gemmatimonadota bacterium]